MPTASSIRLKLEPLTLSCTHTDCEQGVHCFRESKRRAKHPSGSCQDCGATLVDWERLKQRSPADVAHTFEALRTEWIRHRFWHVEINERATNYAFHKGRSGLRVAAEKRIIRHLAKVRGWTITPSRFLNSQLDAVWLSE